MISSSRATTLYVPFFSQVQKKILIFAMFLVRAAFKNQKKIRQSYEHVGYPKKVSEKFPELKKNSIIFTIKTNT
jgi:hypothetical protein